MYEDFEIETGGVTAEYVLRVFQDQHRQGVALCEADEDIAITFDTTIAEWRDADDLRTWWEFAKAMNRAWQIDIPRGDWRAAMKPAKSKTLRGVCELIAREAVVPQMTPVTVFGVSCESAGAFFAIRKMLEDAGADVNNIAPSTPLDPFTREFACTFLGPIANLSPGALSDIQYDHPLHDLTVRGLVAGGILGLISLATPSPAFRVFAFGLFGISFVAAWVAAFVLPRSVTFGNLVAFRDLAKAIGSNPTAGQCP